MKYGVFGSNKFQLLWDSKELAEQEAVRLSVKYNKPFYVLEVCSTIKDGKVV